MASRYRLEEINQKLKNIVESSKTASEGYKSCLRVQWKLLAAEKHRLEKEVESVGS